jgi:glyoxylase-like metal-dependent hydrolase (beta-lactamase superfamily II)
MPDALPNYQLYAIRYATRGGRRADHFIGGDPHDAPMPMDYFVWLAVDGDRSVVIDAGFTEATAKKRGRTFLRCPVAALELLGVDGTQVKDVVLTHLHYDHVGNFHRFPQAQFHLQEPELHYAVGRYMRYQRLAHSFEVEDVVGMVRLNYARRVTLYNGPAELAPGITLHPAHGHSAGLQFVRVHTGRGWVVLASDVTHFYENLETERPFTTAFHVGEMLEGYDKLRAAAPTPQHIVPGHDPEVMRRYPPPRPELDGIAVRLDVAPTV